MTAKKDKKDIDGAFFLSSKKVDDDLKYPHEQVRFHRKDVEKFMVWATEIGASDITIQTGSQIALDIDGKIKWVTKHYLDHSEVMEMVVAMHGSESSKAVLSGNKDMDFPYQVQPTRDTKYRFRVNAVGITVNGGDGVEITARTIPGIPIKLSVLNIEPEIIKNMAPLQGMIVVTGGTGSGKSTLLSSIIRELIEQPNGNRKIITFESPIEFVYDDVDNPTTLISQTEIGKSLKSFVEGTRNALRRKPSVILLGEARDAETIGEAVTASMTGHLLYTTVHSNGFSETISRMINVFNEDKNSRAVDILTNLRMVVSQRLVNATNGKRIALREYVVMNNEIVDFVLNSGLDNLTASCRKVLVKYGRSFLQDATDKFKKGLISEEVWKEFAHADKAQDLDIQEMINKIKSEGKIVPVDLSVENKVDDAAKELGLSLKPSANSRFSPSFQSDLSIDGDMSDTGLDDLLIDKMDKE